MGGEPPELSFGPPELSFGPYVLEERLGGGAMGELWLARRRELSLRVALKRASQPTSETSEALRAEGRLLGRLRSQRTLRVLDVGSARSEAYLALELLEGFDLERLVVRRGPLPEARVLNLLEQACASIGELHRLGWVHRDLTPSNLMSCRFGLEVEQLKVLDFGIAARRGSLGRPCGTPGYIAPEQQEGAVDPRADVYALGCCAYFLLTGRPVFQARSAGELLEKHGHADPLPPAELAEVSPATNALVLRALSKAPPDRYPDAWSLRQALEELDRPRWSQSEARAWWEPAWPYVPEE